MTGERASEQLTLRQILLAGQLAINLPVFGGFALLELAFGGEGPPITLLVAGLWAYFWWAILTPRWRSWALRNGADPEGLYRWGFRTGLLFPRGSLLEKAEIYLSDRAFFGLLSAFLFLVFVTTETLLSELLEAQMGNTGHFGALVAGGISAAVVLPVHHVLKRFIKKPESLTGQVHGSGFQDGNGSASEGPD